MNAKIGMNGTVTVFRHMEVMMNYCGLLWNLYQLKRNMRMRQGTINNAPGGKKAERCLVYTYDNSTYYHRVFEEAGITRRADSAHAPCRHFLFRTDSFLMEHFK